MKLFLNSERCIACGLCIRKHPELFTVDDQGIAHTKNDQPIKIERHQLKELKKTIQNCPAHAFKIEKD